MKKYLAMKLVSGSDIIGKVKSADDNIIVLEKVMLIISSVYENGSTIVFLRPWATLTTDKHISIPTQHIITSYSPRKELVEYYETMIIYSEKFIESDIVNGMTGATKVIKKVIETGRNKPTQEMSLEEELEDYYSSLSIKDKSKAH